MTTGRSARFDAIVLGGGANGLAAAALLAKAGRRTVLLEAGATAVGDAQPVDIASGFAAPPLALDAGWVPSGLLSDLELRLPERVQAAVPLTVAVPSGEFLSLAADSQRVAEALRRHSPGDAATWPEFVRLVRSLAEFLELLYQMPAPDIHTTAPGELLDLARLALTLRRRGRHAMSELFRAIPMSVQELLDDRFAHDPLKAAVAAGGVQDIRQGPRSGGTAFLLLHHLVGARAGVMRGRGYWAAGADALTATLTAAAKRHGVTVRTRSAVERLLVTDYQIAGVALRSGEEIAASTVLSGLDPVRTVGLVDPAWLDPEFADAVRHIKLRGATAFVLYALEALPDLPGLPTPDEALAGTITLTGSTVALERAYDAAKYQRISEHPHVEITAPSIRWPTLAPTGRHVLVARAAWAPYHLEGAWSDDVRDRLAERVTAAISCVAPGFSDRVLHRRVLAPPDLEALFGVTEGAVTHGELTLDQILFMRPVPGWSRYALPVRGLFLCGNGAHPGPGIPGGAGWLAARQALDR